MRAAVTARGQGGKPPRTPPQATGAMRPLRARCGRYHEESVAELGARMWELDFALGRPRGKRHHGRGIVQPSTHNATPEEDYRTALLSDSPDAGCSLCGCFGEGERPGREAGLRYSAGRARRGRGRSLLRCFKARSFGFDHELERGPGRPAGRRARGTNHHRSIGRPRKPAHAGTHTTQKTTNEVTSRGRNLPEQEFYLIERSKESGLRLWLLGVDTVRRGVTTPVCTPVTTGTEQEKDAARVSLVPRLASDTRQMGI